MLWFKMVNEKFHILKYLIENIDAELSIRKISKIRNINYKSAYNAIKNLEKEKIVSLNKLGNISICKFNKSFNELVFAVEFNRKNDLLKNKNFKVIYRSLIKINQQFIVLVFGSYAKKSAVKGSDIDVLIISDQPEKVEEELSLFPLNIHATSISYNEFRAMLNNREMTVVSEAVKKNVILVGIEDYYRLINNAQ